MSEQPNISDDRPDEPPGDATLAGEYVLGLLAPSERARAEARIAADPAFASLVESWTSRLQPLADTVAPVAPPARVWNGIETRIGGRRTRPSVWDSLAFWRWTTALASAAALAGFILSGALLDDKRTSDA